MNTNELGNQFDIQKRIDAFRHNRQAGSSVSGLAGKSTEQIQGRNAFADVLTSKVEGLKFSAHASTRIKSRNIEVTSEVIGKLEKAVSGAAEKGARDSLVLMKNCAFIVNIPNRTVITAMDGNSMNNNIFTNIDSAVLAD